MDRSDVATLIAIAQNAGKRQILEVGNAAVLAAHDMIYLVRKASIGFVDKAVFATMSSAAGYVSTDLLADIASHGR